jgi:conserved domain protein
MGYFNVNLFFLKLKSIFNEFKSSEKGVTAIEYGLIAVAVAAMIVATFYTYPSLVSTIRNDLIAVATIVMGQTF